MKQYQYNYSYLERWRQANYHITDREILQAIGSTSNSSLALYEQRKCPMPLISLLRFCNAFDVPISAFIVGIDTEVGDVNDQLEPDGGYLDSNAKRPLGSRALRNPLDVMHIPSNVPDIAKDVGSSPPDAPRTEEVKTEENAPAPIATAHDGHEPHEGKADIGISTLNKMLDIIAEQQKQIGDQQKLIAHLTQQLEAQQPIHVQQSYNMVAEGIHHDNS